MAPNVKVQNAFRAMRAIGIPDETVKPVLKNLLQVYDKNWELIEEENYRVLADAIFKYEENKEAEVKKRKEAKFQEESGPPKRLRLKYQVQASPSAGNIGPVSRGTAIARPKTDAHLTTTSSSEDTAEPSQLLLRDRGVENDAVSPEMHFRDQRNEPTSPRSCPRLEKPNYPLCPRDRTTERGSVSPQIQCRGNEKGIVLSPQTCNSQEREEIYHSCLRYNGTGFVSQESQLKGKGKKPISPRIPSGDKMIFLKGSHGIDRLSKEKLPKSHPYSALIKPKSEPLADDLADFELPVAMIHPNDTYASKCRGSMCKDDASIGNDSITQDEPQPTSQNMNRTYIGDGVLERLCKSATGFELANIPESSSADFEIASSPMGEVKVSLSCNSALGLPDFHVPSLDAVLRMVEDKCLNSYKIMEPKFSIVKVMKELCESFLDVGMDSTQDKGGVINVTPTLDSFKKPLTGSLNSHSSVKVVIPQAPCLPSVGGLGGFHRIIHPKKLFEAANGGKDEKNDLKGSQSSNSTSSVVVHQKQFTFDDVKPLHDKDDIAKGEERVRIPFVNEISSEPYPPSFHYIPHNIVYQNAYVNFSLARIGDDDCCSNCCGDCMSSSIPCACARETGGEFAYTPEGLIQKKFLDDSISMSRDPHKHSLFYCKDCPLERSKNEDLPDQCKGHFVRKFIKECWSKCGCNKQCGNRVVQRGITCKLQVFLTPEGKGWGLRTLEDLPRGAFVCEYVGEILTNTELYERNMRSTGNEKHTYPVLLDADWGSEGVLKDEEALCLDATFYGNVARFINHRCFNANLVEIPVEIETPDHHYYHIAFFTSRKVEALEELTWDYQIDFDDHDHPIKAFRCLCGSKGCRDMTRTKRTKSSAFILK